MGKESVIRYVNHCLNFISGSGVDQHVGSLIYFVYENTSTE